MHVPSSEHPHPTGLSGSTSTNTAEYTIANGKAWIKAFDYLLKIKAVGLDNDQYRLQYQGKITRAQSDPRSEQLQITIWPPPYNDNG